jgi:hypothetical protein
MRFAVFSGTILLAALLAGCGGSVQHTTTNTQVPPSAFMFVSSPNNAIVVGYGVSSSGMLSQLGTTSATLTPGSPLFLNTDPAGHFLYVSQEAIDDDDTGQEIGADGLSIFHIDQNSGMLTQVGPFIPLSDTRLPLAILFSPSGFALTGEGTNVGVFRQDASTGLLQEVQGSPFALGGQLAAVSPAADIFVTFTPADSMVHTFSVDASGTPKLVSSTALSGHAGGQALFTRDGGTLLATFGDPQTEQSFGFDVFTVAPDGTLALVKSVALPHSSQLAFTPDQRFLYTVSSADISTFSTTNFTAVGSPMAFSPIGPILTPPVVSGNALFVSEFFHIHSFPADLTTGALGADTDAADISSGAMWMGVSPAK